MTNGNFILAGLGICPLSGFTRRLFLQVLLEDENILVAFRASPKQYHIHVPTSQGCLQHPQFGAGRRFRTMLVNMHITVGELINKVSGSCLFIVCDKISLVCSSTIAESLQTSFSGCASCLKILFITSLFPLYS